MSLGKIGNTPRLFDISGVPAGWPAAFPGIVRLRALAVLRLMTNTNLFGCTIGKSAGFSPLTMRPVTPTWRTKAGEAGRGNGMQSEGRRHRFVQQLKALSRHLCTKAGDAGEIARGTIKARYHACATESPSIPKTTGMVCVAAGFLISLPTGDISRPASRRGWHLTNLPYSVARWSPTVDAAVSTANVTDVPALLGRAIGGYYGQTSFSGGFNRSRPSSALARRFGSHGNQCAARQLTCRGRMGFQARVDEILRLGCQRCRNGSLPIAAARLDRDGVEPVRPCEQAAIRPTRLSI